MMHLKNFRNSEKSMMMYCPISEERTPFKRSVIFVLMDNASYASVEQLCTHYNLLHLADKANAILCFPLVKQWHNETYDTFKVYFNGCDKPDDDPLPVDDQGIPLLSAMLKSWHPMSDVRYIVGLGTGADFALSLAAQHPNLPAAIWSINGQLSQECSPLSPMPVWLTNANEKTIDAFLKSNETDTKLCDKYLRYYSSRNPVQQVIVDNNKTSAAVVNDVWSTLFSCVRRTNTCPHGDAMPRTQSIRQTMNCIIDDSSLNGIPHTWFLHVPNQPNPNERFPLVMYFHGGSDNPAEAAEGCYLHCIGEKERFITVYPWATNRCSWNSSLEANLPDDVSFITKLILRIINDYPIDESRIYLSGFSNGAAMAQTYALLHPELIAAIFHIDSNWPGKRGGYQPLHWRDVLPFAKGMAIKQDFDYLMPIWYTYGSRELSYPIRKDSTQQHQYDFWKMYNHLTIQPTPNFNDIEAPGCGVHGDKSEILYPDKRHPAHWYEIESFVNSKGISLYNYVVMHEKGHEVAEMDPVLGWQYVRQFARDKDGTLLLIKEDGTIVPVKN